ncbi:fibronectin type III domain-containing protein [Deinococcus humi]|uniref:Fibronectin type-III domain-containing protein n=1 Tax=Deinococcus humi TaxID=662880 RepID=A0A7W8NDZ7_9DEIO|nr:fibronectin type III domain-containing protein [Deinococcus humi]MBB5362851.1 hypothetical protein [Deinococcus humi]
MQKREMVGFLMLTGALASCGDGGAAPGQIPANPTTFTAAAKGSTQVQLDWSGVEAGAHVVLERKFNNGAYATLKDNLTTTSWLDENLTPNTTYTYRLKATNAVGSSSGLEKSATTADSGNPDFTLDATPNTLSIGPGQSSATTVSVTRPQNPDGTVALTLEGEVVGTGPDKIAGTFSEGNNTLSLTVGSNVPVGLYDLTVRGTNGSVTKAANVRVVVEKWLLVDDDRSGNNWPTSNPAPDSDGDKFMRAAMAGKVFDVAVVPYSASGQAKDEPDGPSTETMKKYSGVMWYTGNTIVNPVTSGDVANLQGYLNTANRKVVLFSPGFVRTSATNGSTMAEPGEAVQTFFKAYAGVDKLAYAGLINGSYTVTGQANTVMQGLSLTLKQGANRADLAPGQGTQTLLSAGSAVVATVRSGVGTATSSRLTLLGLPTSNLTQDDTTALLGKLMR